MPRTIGMARTAKISLLESLMYLLQVASAQSETCPAFTASEIDAVFEVWGDSIGLSPDEMNVVCHDDPVAPATRIEVDIARPDEALLLVFVQRNVAGCAFKIMGENMHCISAERHITLHVPNGQVCRAQILSSYSWRQHCENKIVRD